MENNIYNKSATKIKKNYKAKTTASIHYLIAINLIIFICFSLGGCRNNIDLASSSIQSTTNENDVINSTENEIQETNSSDLVETEENNLESVSSDTTNTNNSSSKKETSANNTSSKQETVTSSTVESTNSNNISSTPKVVQSANPDTGISWDGVSPIIYTYEDGTTGTTPQNGAKYEVIPGIYGEYWNFNEVYDGICDYCGKKQGDGTNGTCVVHRMSDTCPNCGATGMLNKCHTCP